MVCSLDLLVFRLVLVVAQGLKQSVFVHLHVLPVVYAVNVILAVFAFALVCAWDIPFIALTVFLLAVGGLALATFEMLRFILVHLVFESLDVSFQNLSDGYLPLVLVHIVVLAWVFFSLDLLALTRWTACCFVPKTLAVKLQAFSVFAFAPKTLLDSRLHLSDLGEEFVLALSRSYDLLSHEVYLLLILHVQLLFLLNRDAWALRRPAA